MFFIKVFFTIDGTFCGFTADSQCGDWEPYNDEKCFKILDKVGLQTYEDAQKTCHQQEISSSLISIRSLEEQEFLYNLFKTYKVVDNAWIGAKYTANNYKWSDDSDLVFNNWAEGSPKMKTDLCVQLQSEETLFGQWSDVLCDKKNVVVCQKLQTLSLSQLQKILFHVKENPVPIGFIYVELPNEKSPTEIWPWMTWNDTTSAYAGLFFRAVGEKSAPFGQVQEDNAPHLVHVDPFARASFQKPPILRDLIDPFARASSFQKSPILRDPIDPHTDYPGWGKRIIPDDTYVSLLNILYSDYKMSSGEVRPRNMAIRVWKRVG